MKVTGLFVVMITGMTTSIFAQNKTVVKSPWVAKETRFYAKDARDMNQTDTLVLVPWRKPWGMCCLVLCPYKSDTWLADVGLYRTKAGATVLKGGLGRYLGGANTIATLDYHWSPNHKSRQVGINVLHQFLPFNIRQGDIKGYLFRGGFNAGVAGVKTQDVQAYIEPKLGIITPFGRHHLYASYRFINTNNEAYKPLQGWNFGTTFLLTRNY